MKRRFGRHWWYLAATATALAGIAAAAPSASAGPGFHITLNNSLTAPGLPAPVRLVAARARSCWYDKDLWPPERAPVANPGRSIRLYTEKNSEAFSGCHRQYATRGIDIEINEPGIGWRTPTASPGDYRIRFSPDETASNFGFNFRDGLSTWLPRPDGRGLVCWDTYTYTDKKHALLATGYADIKVLGDKRCNRYTSPDVNPDPNKYASTSSAGKDAVKAAQDKGADGNIVNLLTTVGVACGWYAFPSNQSYCNGLNVGDQAKWVLDNVPRKVRDFKVTNSIVNAQPKQPVGNAVADIPAGAKAGSVAVNKRITTRTDTQTTTTHGANVGVEFGFEETSSIGMAGIAQGGFKATQKVTAGYNYSQAKGVTTSQEQAVDINIQAGAKPGYTTTLDVFTTKVAANYEYSADLTFGEPGKSAATVNPGTRALGMSPATRHPCLAYLVGDQSVRNSITNIGKALTDAGYKENEPTLARDRRAYLRGVSGFTTAKEPCPGFPAGFASQAIFKGRGVGTYDNLGYDEEGNPRNAVVGCVYQIPNRRPTRSARTTRFRQAQASSSDSPCQTIQGGAGRIAGTVTPGASGSAATASPGARGRSSSVSAKGAGVLIEARGAGRTPGTSVSDKVIGGDRDERISTGSGSFDQVYAQGGDDRVSGGPGQDLIFGGTGDDRLEGGGGFDTVNGGAGDDRIAEQGGAGSMSGDDGADTLIASADHRLTMLGGRGDDRLVVRGKSASSLGGGLGDDTYVLTARGKTNVFEMPGEGTDVLKTDRSIVVPSGIEKAAATGGRRVKLRSGQGRQTLVGNRAANVLEAGVGSDRVRAGGGGDRILLNEFGFDRVTGGKGRDSFVPLGTPANADRPARLEDPPHRAAHRITDFHPRRGDRVVMRPSVFGKALLKRRKLAIVRDHNPKPRGDRATILFDDRTGLVSFDRDGTGPISDKVAVVLPDAKTLKRRWLEIRR
jgi:hypothetical protein